MKNEDVFEKIGKKVPYEVPADFFDMITEKTLANAKRRQRNFKTRHLIIWTSVAASVVVIMVFAGLNFNRFRQMEERATFVQAEENIPSEISGRSLGIFSDSVPVSDLKNDETEQFPLSEKSEELQSETLENLIASLSDEELRFLAGQIYAELYLNELIEE